MEFRAFDNLIINYSLKSLSIEEQGSGISSQSSSIWHTLSWRLNLFIPEQPETLKIPKVTNNCILTSGGTRALALHILNPVRMARALVAEHSFKAYDQSYPNQDRYLNKGLLSMSVDPAVRSTISDIDNPYLALEKIKSVCKMSDSRALGITLSQLEDLKTTRNDIFSTFMNKVTLMQSDINELDGFSSDHQVIAKVIRYLPPSFANFVLITRVMRQEYYEFCLTYP